MMRLNIPSQSISDVLTACIAGIGTNDFKNRTQASSAPFNAQSELYSNLANKACLYLLKAFCEQNKDTRALSRSLVLGELTKDDLTDKLYEYYFRNLNKKTARAIYDSIKNSAREKCPYCGGIGVPTTLDHFLPQANFPQFSVLPINLIPACHDCNIDYKKTYFAQSPGAQIIHPYFDNEKFFCEQWLYAKLIDNEFAISYFANPPQFWSDTDKERVNSHFTQFKLEKRLSTQAAQQLAIIKDQWVYSPLKSDKESFIEVILNPVANGSLFINHWQRVLYQALINDFDKFIALANQGGRL